MSNRSIEFGAAGSQRTPLAGRSANVPAVDSGALQPSAQGAAGGRGFNFDEALRVILRWKWLILGAMLVGIALAIVITLTSTKMYRAVATIEINVAPTEIMGNDQGLQGKVRNTEQFLQTQYGLLQSRSLAERVARTLNLGSDPSFGGGKRPGSGGLSSATDAIAGGLTVRPVRGSALVELSYTDVDAVRAQKIVNAFAVGFIAETTEKRYDATAFARSFLQNRLDSTRAKLEESERKLVNYAQEKGILQLDQSSAMASGGKGSEGAPSPGGDSLSSQSLVALNGALAQATNERIVAEQRYRQAMSSSATTDLLSNPAVQALRSERSKLEADYREKLATFKSDYPEMVALRARIAQIDRDLGREGGDVTSSLRSAYLAAQGHEAQLRGQIGGLRGDVLDLRNRGIGYNTLQRDAQTNRALYDALLQRFKEIGVVGGLGEAQATVVDPATVPLAPFKPQPLFNLAVGLLAGLILGLMAAFTIEFVDDTIKSSDDVTNKLRLTTLGMIPTVAKPKTLMEELSDPKSAVTEAYYSVVAALQFATDNGLPRTILVASSRAAEGKSTTSLAIAQNLARLGGTVLLIDADMRSPSFLSSASGTIGLSKLLVSNEKLVDHVTRTNIPGLSLLPAGTIPPNPAELLGTRRIHSLIADAASAFDVVVVDAPPVLGLADTPVLASICEATVMIVESGSVRRATILGALTRLANANAHVVGVVLTKFSTKTAGYGYGGYGYGYGQEKAYGAVTKQPLMLDVTA